MDGIQLAQQAVALAVTAYWLCVVVMVTRSWIRFRSPAGAIPKTRLEKRMWYVWLPTLAAWITLTWSSTNQLLPAVQGTSLEKPLMFLTWVAAASTWVAFLATTRCWLKMGKNWTMAVRPDKETELITAGAFAWVRHPIYALSLMLMLSSLVVVANWMMCVVAAIHCTMLYIKTWSEERHLTKLHGSSYRQYRQQTGRFLPWRALCHRLV